MEAVSEVAHLTDGPQQLSSGRVNELAGPLHLAARLVEPHGEGDEALLRTVVEIALDPAPLGIGRVHDPHTRGADLLELGADLRGETLVLERHPGDRRNRLDAPGILDLDRRVEDEDGQELALALEAGNAARHIRAGRNLDREAIAVDESIAAG